MSIHSYWVRNQEHCALSEIEPSNAPGDPIDAVPRAAEAAARSIWPDTSVSHLQAALLVDAGDKTLHATECPGADTLGLEGMVGRDWREVFAEFDEIEIESDSSPDTSFFLARESSRIAEPGAAYRVRTWGTAPAAATPGGSFVLIEAIGDPAAVRELIYHERMAALGQIAAGVAHEVNNSLTIVSGWLQILLLQVDRQDKILAPLRLMKEEVGRIASIIHRLLSFGRRTPVEQQLVRVNRLLADVLGLVEYQIRNENIEVLTELCPNLPMVMGDPNQLKQVFLNIVVNARQAMPGGGTLVLTSDVSQDAFVRAFKHLGIDPPKGQPDLF